MNDPQKLWLRRLAALNPNVQYARGTGAGRFAPHKPILLLALLDVAEAGELTDRRSPLTPGLRLRFNALWQTVVRRWTTKPDPFLPFHHLSSQGFWQALRTTGEVSEGPDSTRQIQLHPEFFELLQQPQFRALARTLLIHTWFPAEEQVSLRETLGLETELAAAEPSILQEERAEYERTGRDARFRIQVIVQYQYTCALTGYSLTAAHSGATIVEAAHIAAFADTRNNDPRNGLALTPDAHWSFDEGLWTVDNDLRVVVANDVFADWSPEGTSLKHRHGRPLHFAASTRLRPDHHYLEWHRENRFAA
jgi:putative restriction endonuclease